MSTITAQDFPTPGRRILLWGGGGKTSLSRALGEKLGLPVIEADAINWLPGWTERDPDEFVALIHAALDEAGDEWVMDGNYTGHLGNQILRRADTVIWLDLPWRVIFWRISRRAIARARDRRLICGENVESWRQTFLSRDSLPLFHIRRLLTGTHKRGIARREAFIRESGAHVTVIRLRSARQLDDFYAAHGLARPAG